MYICIYIYIYILCHMHALTDIRTYVPTYIQACIRAYLHQSSKLNAQDSMGSPWHKITSVPPGQPYGLMRSCLTQSQVGPSLPPAKVCPFSLLSILGPCISWTVASHRCPCSKQLRSDADHLEMMQRPFCFFDCLVIIVQSAYGRAHIAILFACLTGNGPCLRRPLRSALLLPVGAFPCRIAPSNSLFAM